MEKLISNFEDDFENKFQLDNFSVTDEELIEELRRRDERNKSNRLLRNLDKMKEYYSHHRQELKKEYPELVEVGKPIQVVYDNRNEGRTLSKSWATEYEHTFEIVNKLDKLKSYTKSIITKTNSMIIPCPETSLQDLFDRIYDLISVFEPHDQSIVNEIKDDLLRSGLSYKEFKEVTKNKLEFKLLYLFYRMSNENIINLIDEKGRMVEKIIKLKSDYQYLFELIVQLVKVLLDDDNFVSRLRLAPEDSCEHSRQTFLFKLTDSLANCINNGEISNSLIKKMFIGHDFSSIFREIFANEQFYYDYFNHTEDLENDFSLNCSSLDKNEFRNEIIELLISYSNYYKCLNSCNSGKELDEIETDKTVKKNIESQSKTSTQVQYTEAEEENCSEKFSEIKKKLKNLKVLRSDELLSFIDYQIIKIIPYEIKYEKNKQVQKFRFYPKSNNWTQLIDQVLFAYHREMKEKMEFLTKNIE
jgi:hypothetical protein